MMLGFFATWIVVARRFGLVRWDFLWTHRREGLAGACTPGLVFTRAIVLTAPPTGRGLVADLFLGRRENPQLWVGRSPVDAKMLLYLFGAVQLELNLGSFAAHHVLAHPDAASPGSTGSERHAFGRRGGLISSQHIASNAPFQGLRVRTVVLPIQGP